MAGQSLFVFEEIQQSFLAHRSADRASKMQAYMKHKFMFFGIASPNRKELSRNLLKITKNENKVFIKELINLLWNAPQRELQYFALDLIQQHKKSWTRDDLEFGEELVLTKSWWDTVDSLAPNFFGVILKPENHSNIKYQMYCCQHDYMWMNRVALIYQLKYKSEVNTEFLYHCINSHKHQSEFFIRKASGWALRQYSKYNPSSVQEFLDTTTDLSKLTIREASKYL